MMEIEESVMDLTNTIGRGVVTPGLTAIDSLGWPIMVGMTKFYSRGQIPEVNQIIFRRIFFESHGQSTKYFTNIFERWPITQLKVLRKIEEGSVKRSSRRFAFS
jgi:hypothetical protein